MKNHKNIKNQKGSKPGIKICNGQVIVDNQTLSQHRPPDSLNFHYIFLIPEHNTARAVNLTLN